MSPIILNEDQTAALAELEKFVKSEDRYMYLLEGAAGTGKTTIISHFIQKMMDSHLFSDICMSSPTHKALKVMAEMCPPALRSHVAFSTIHSMLGMQREITSDGNEIFARDPKVMTKFPFFDLVIVDESSMIADELFNEMESQNYKKIKILFVGDSNQINPINHVMSIPMLPEKREEFNIGYVRLDKIVRQAEGNPIIKYSQQIIKDEFTFVSGHKEMVDETGVVMISSIQTAVIAQLIRYYFNTEAFDNDANHCKIIAWRNVTVDYYNRMVRASKYGPKAPKIVVNEKLIVDRPILADNRKDVLFNVNEDIEVTSIDIKEKTLYDKTVWKYYECIVKSDTRIETIHILHESEQGRHTQYLKSLSKAAVAEKDKGKRQGMWVKYFSTMENFSQVKYNYAITCHCAQGSTYDNCFVMNSDIVRNQNEDERRRIQYTAVTRPRKMLYIL